MAKRGPSDNELYLMHRKRRELVLTPDERRADGVLEIWMSAARLRRAVERALLPHRISFSQWRVLYTTDRIQREFADGMTQVEVAKRLDADEATVSAVMRRLLRAGLVDIEPAFWSNLNEVLVTTKGRRLLESTLGQVVRAADELFLTDQASKAG